jgi:sterol O-acyltransferase
MALPQNAAPESRPPLTSAESLNGERFVVRGPDRKTSDSTLGASALGSADHSADEWSVNTSNHSSLSDEEDYDELKHDPKTMVEGSLGGGLKINTMNGHSNGIPQASSTEKVVEVIRPTSPAARIPLGDRRRSIQITLEKTNKKGKYILTADDPEYREIMRNLIERDMDSQSKRPRFRDLVFTRRFTTFDRLNPTNADSPFFGFFTLFWLCIGGMLVRVAAQNWRQYGSVLGQAEIFHLMFERDVIVLGLTDGAMTAATLFGVALQKIIAKGYFSWNKYGWILQNIWQTFYLFAVLWWTIYRDWPWTHTVFTVLHSLVFLMKQHSYAFYNGYLSQVYRRRHILEAKLRQLEDIEPVMSPITPQKGFSSAVVNDSPERSRSPNVRRRRSSAATTKANTKLSKETSEVSAIAAAVDAGRPLDEEQLEAFSSVMRSEIQSLTEELNGKATSKDLAYPHNLTIANWWDWTCIPTLVYELEYPRQESRNWFYIAEKSVATLGCIWVMIIVSQQYIYPPVMETVRMKKQGMSLDQRWAEFPWIMGDMLFPLLLEQLMTWYVIWECLLNVLAEITRFADRGFYGDWWNSVSFDQYARDWNRPVHNFLLRHVYHSSISAFKLSKGMATFATFLLSALVHELVMFCLFKKVRGYLFFMQLSQIPLAMMSRSRLMKGRKVMGNVVFWFGLFLGPSIITSLYLIV